jgi:hypothetical protein
MSGRNRRKHDAGSLKVSDVQKANESSARFFSPAESVGLAFATFGLLLSVFAPSVIAKSIILVCFSAGIFVLARKFHWARAWPPRYKNGVAALTVLIVAALAIPQLVTQWRTDHLIDKTYVYLIPGRGLAERSKDDPQEMTGRRAFVLKQVGLGVLHNVEVDLTDLHATNSQATQDMHTESYPEIDPPTPGSNAPAKYFWWRPVTEWNEDYTVTLNSREKNLVERIKIVSIRGSVYFAIRVSTAGSTAPLFSCADSGLTDSLAWPSDPPQSCQDFLPAEPGFSGSLDPKPYGLFPSPDSFIDMSPPAQPISSHPEVESDDRRLTEWQQSVLKPALDAYPGKKVLILAAGSKPTWDYARDFRDAFLGSKWIVKGPIDAPKTDQTVLDVQISSGDASGSLHSETTDVRDAMVNAGIKGAKFFVVDPSVKTGVIVLWVGVRSPDEIRTPQFPIRTPKLKELLATF